MTTIRKTDAHQPEVLAGLAAAAKSGGQKPKAQGVFATPATAPVEANVAQEVDAATKVLRKGATGKDGGAAKAVEALPDRTRPGKS